MLRYFVRLFCHIIQSLKVTQIRLNVNILFLVFRLPFWIKVIYHRKFTIIIGIISFFIHEIKKLTFALGRTEHYCCRSDGSLWYSGRPIESVWFRIDLLYFDCWLDGNDIQSVQSKSVCERNLFNTAKKTKKVWWAFKTNHKWKKSSTCYH